MKTIITPTDFSSISENACLYAAKMAADIQAELVLLHVMELPIAVAEYPVSVVSEFDEAGIQQELETFREKLIRETSGNVTVHIKNILGSVEHELKELCKRNPPFAVVMGTHAAGVLDRFFLGSTTVYSAKHLPCPVLVVPGGVEYTPIRKIALATDLKDVGNLSLQEIETMVNTFQASLEIFYVGKNEKDIEKASTEKLLLYHHLSQFEPEFDFIENEDVEQGISLLAEKNSVDLVLIIPKKHGLFHKSQSKEFIFYSLVPVMAIHESDFAHAC
jgi:nucleotide-binding universal stress UspA family protein